jgi:hypothetical protein
MRVGRTEWADFNIPQDGALAPVHFAIEFQANICRIRDLGGGSGTLINGQPVADGIVSHGDRITAGATTFSVQIEGNSATAPVASQAPLPRPSPAGGVSAPAPQIQSSGFANVPTALAAKVCEQFELDDQAKPLLEPQLTVRQFFVVLGKQQMHADAARLLAHALPKREAVWWAAQCVRVAFGDQLGPADKAAAAAEKTKHETAAGWAAGAAFWSGGSIAPAGLPEVPPKETLTAQAVVVAITMSAASDPKRMAARQVEFLALGARVADGEVRWKQP